MLQLEETDIVKEIKEYSDLNYHFILEAIENLRENDITIKVFNSSKTPDNCGGYFDCYDKVLALSIQRTMKSFVELFAHEYCHFIQWKKGLKVWKEIETVTDYLHPATRNLDITDDIKKVQRLERDCDKRVLDLIKKKKLELNYTDYLIDANCYVAFHDIIKITRTWNKYSIYNSELQAMMPKDRLIKTINCLGRKKEEFIIKCIKKVY